MMWEVGNSRNKFGVLQAETFQNKNKPIPKYFIHRGQQQIFKAL